jgi:exoribonuclease-2
MPDTLIRRDGLVLYRTRPARVIQIGKKLEIELEGGERVSVRPKDVMPLHRGPLSSLDRLQARAGEVETAWELLAGETTSLAELADLAYGEYTPETAWAAWQVIEDGLYFAGTAEEVVARTPEEVAEALAARQEKAERKEARASFLARARRGKCLPEDGRYLRKIADLALGRSEKSRLLRELGRKETPENAHALLLKLGYWDHQVDPYPIRLGLPTDEVDLPVPDLPQEERLDLTHLPAYAIDDEGSQEPDDALSVDGDRLWVHIADVAALVPPDSPIDLEARARGATLYLPEGQAPMLPWKVVRMLGLGLQEVSPALSFGIDLTDEGEIADLQVAASWVRVTRLTYEAAEEQLEENDHLRRLLSIAQRFQARREAGGAIAIDLPEIRIRVRDGDVEIRPLLRLRSRALVTEAMLMAGAAVAGYAMEHGIPCPFTTQDPPDTQERPTDLAGMYALRRALRPGEQSGIPGPHTGLGLERYVQATSPLRRYLDLVVHQQLRAHLETGRLMDDQEILERIGAAAAVTGSVRHAERLARRHWTLVYLQQHPDWRGEGVLVDRRGRSGVVIVPELDLEPRVQVPPGVPLNSPVSLALRGVDLPGLRGHFQVAGEG